MSWYDRMLNQDATYWPPGEKDAFGNNSYGEPQQIRCRWEDIQELFVTKDGEEKRSSCTVFVNADLDNSGYLALGIIDNDNPTVVNGAFLIQKFEKIPSITAGMFQRKAWL